MLYFIAFLQVRGGRMSDFDGTGVPSSFGDYFIGGILFLILFFLLEDNSKAES